MQKVDLRAMNVGEFVEVVKAALESGEITPEHKIVLYSSAGRHGINRHARANPVHEPAFNAPGILMLSFAK